MSTIDSSNSLNTILDKLGIQKPAKETGSSDKLGQADFLKLMTTQLQNQDPFAPMENAELDCYHKVSTIKCGIIRMSTLGENTLSIPSEWMTIVSSLIVLLANGQRWTITKTTT